MNHTTSPATLALVVDRPGATVCQLLVQGYAIVSDTGDAVHLQTKAGQLPTVIVTTAHKHLDDLGLLDDDARELVATYHSPPILTSTPEHGSVTIVDSRRAA